MPAVRIGPPIKPPPQVSATRPTTTKLTPTVVTPTTDIPARKGVTTVPTTSINTQRLAEIEAEHFREKNIKLDTGEWVSREEYNKLEPTERSLLKCKGIEALNKELQQKAERKYGEAVSVEQKRFQRDNVQVGDGEWVSKKDFNKLDSEAQRLVKRLGVTGYNEYVEAENTRLAQEAQKDMERIDSDYVKVGIKGYEDYVLKGDYDKLDEQGKDLLNRFGVTTYNKLAQDYNTLIEAHNKYIIERSVILPSGELVSKRDWEKFTPTMQKQAESRGLKALDTSGLSGKETFDKYVEWGLIPEGAEYEGITKDGEINYGAPKVWALIPLPQQVIKPSYLRNMYDMQINWKSLKGASDKERAEVYTTIANENIDVAKGLFNKHNVPLPSTKARMGAVGHLAMPEVAKVILPGVWALDWNKMTTMERAINIAIDAAIVGVIVAGATGVRMKPSGRLGRLSLSDYKSTWRTSGTDAFKTIRDKFGKVDAKKFRTATDKISNGLAEYDTKLLMEGTRELRLLGPALEKKGLPVGVIEELCDRVEASGVETLKQQSKSYADWLKRHPRGTKAVSPETITRLKELTDRQIRVITEEKPRIQTFTIPTEMPKAPPARISTALTKYREKGLTSRVGAKGRTKIRAKTISKVKTEPSTAMSKATKVSTALAIAQKVAVDTITKALVEGKTQKQAREEAKTAIRQLTKTAPNTETRKALAVHVATLTDTALALALQLAIQPMAQPATQLATQTLAQELQQPKQEIAVAPHLLPKTQRDIALLPHLRPEEITTKKIIIELPEGKGRLVLTREQYDGIAAWKQGFIYKLIYPPYGQKEIINTREPIKGVTYHKGVGSAARSIIAKQGTVPETIRRDMGIMDITITTPKDSRKPTIKFKRDIKQRTRVTPGIRGIR